MECHILNKSPQINFMSMITFISSIYIKDNLKKFMFSKKLCYSFRRSQHKNKKIKNFTYIYRESNYD